MVVFNPYARCPKFELIPDLFLPGKYQPNEFIKRELSSMIEQKYHYDWCPNTYFRKTFKINQYQFKQLISGEKVPTKAWREKLWNTLSDSWVHMTRYKDKTSSFIWNTKNCIKQIPVIKPKIDNRLFLKGGEVNLFYGTIRT